MAVEVWNMEAELAPGLWRVFAGESTRWFVCAGPPAEARAWVGGAVREARAVGAEGVQVEGLVVPRCEGGLLEAALTALGALSAAQTAAVVAGCAAALEAAPEPPVGKERGRLGAFALDSAARVRLVPGLLADAEPGAEAQAVGELAFRAAAGMSWAEAGVPAAGLPGGLPTALAALIDELLVGGCSNAAGRLDLAEVSAALLACPEPGPLPFIAAEPGIDVGAAATAGLRLDPGLVGRLAPDADAPAGGAVGALRAAHAAGGTGARAERGSRRTSRGAGTVAGRDADRGDDGQRNGRRTGVRTRGGDGGTAALRHRARRGRKGSRIRVAEDRGRSGVRMRGAAAGRRRLPAWLTPRALGLAVASSAVLGGAALLVPGLVAGERTPEPAAAHRPQTTGASGAAADPAGGRTAVADRGSPEAAFAALTAARASAFETGDAEALRALTAEGSPARTAEEGADARRFAGSRVRIEVGSPKVERAAGDQAVVTATMAVSVERDGARRDYGSQRVRTQLRYAGGTWRVYAVERA